MTRTAARSASPTASRTMVRRVLRALIVRNVKPRALVRESNVEMSESDTAAYLFGRSYYLERRLKSAVDGGALRRIRRLDLDSSRTPTVVYVRPMPLSVLVVDR